MLIHLCMRHKRVMSACAMIGACMCKVEDWPVFLSQLVYLLHTEDL